MPPRRNRGPGGLYAWCSGGTQAEPGVTAVGRYQRRCHQRAPRREAPRPQWLAMNLMSRHLMAAGTLMRAQGQREQRERREQRQKEKKEKKAIAQKQVKLGTQKGQTQTQETQTQETQAPERDQPLGVKQSEGAEQGQKQVGECIVALGTMAAKQGRIPYREIMHLTYYKSHAYDDILVEGPGSIRLHGRSIGPHCSAEGKVTARVMCDTRGCTNIDTGRSIPTKVARQWLQLDPVSQRKPRHVLVQRVEVIRMTAWKSNMFYQWLEYSAKQVTNSSCIACHRKMGLPRVKPLPHIEECARTFFCFAQCTMWMAAGRGKHTNNTAICPVSLKDAPNQIKKEYQVPAVVHLAQNTVFPFCIAPGYNIEYWLDNSTSSNTSKEAEELIQCKYENITYQENSVSRRQEKICNTTEEAKIQCEQVVSGASRNSTIVSRNYTDAYQVWIGDLSNGTEPLADIFWMCESNRQVKAVLPANWTGICAPVILTGPITIISLTNNTLKRSPRSTETRTRSWEKDANIYIT
ncbi:hypothetical protein ABVT39_004617 [Epinephelus coioides]